MSLIASLPDDEWTYLPELQGKHTNLLVGVSLHDGEVVALAQWTERPVAGERLDWYCLGWNTDGAGRILTMSRTAVREGRA